MPGRAARLPRDDVDDVDEVVDAVLRASRVLVSVAARSLVGVDEHVTVPQYRALVVLAGRGPQNAGALAAALGVHASTMTRMCDRLVAKSLVTRRASSSNRREVVVALTPRGRRIVRSVTDRRTTEIRTIVAGVPETQRQAMVRALQAFGDAAGEPPDAAWLPGWSDE